MYISFGEHGIKLQSWMNKGQMVEFLAACEAGMLLLGENEDQEIEFYSATVYLRYSQSHKLGIGICSQGHGLVPHVLFQPEISTLLFGFNSDVVRILLPGGDIESRLSLDSLFYSFLPLYSRKMLLVQHEIGVVALTAEGQMIWDFSKDIITNTAIVEDQLHIDFMDAPPVRLNLSNGVIVS